MLGYYYCFCVAFLCFVWLLFFALLWFEKIGGSINFNTGKCLRVLIAVTKLLFSSEMNSYGVVSAQFSFILHVEHMIFNVF